MHGTIALPSQRGVQLAWNGDVRVEGTLVPGDNYTLIMTFHNGAPITTSIPVLAESADFKDVPVGPVPTKPTSPGTVGGSS